MGDVLLIATYFLAFDVSLDIQYHPPAMSLEAPHILSFSVLVSYDVRY